MVIRRHWAEVGISAGIIMAGCGGSSENLSTPKNLSQPTAAQVEKGKQMLGPGMDMLKEKAQMKRGTGSQTPK